MPVDPNVFNNQKTYADYKNQQDALDLQRAVTGQALQTGQIDTLTKQNTLKGQYLSAAAGTGDQATWDATRQKLSGLGIDVSDAPADVGTGAKYADALRLSQTPYGALLKGGAEIAGITGKIPNALVNVLPGGPPPQQANPGVASPQASPAQPIDDRGGGIAIDASSLIPGNAVGAPSRQVAAPKSSIELTPKDPSETMDAYKLRLSNDPNVIAGQEKAKETGKTQAAAQKNAIQSDEGFKLVTQNLDSIINMAPKLPQSKYFIPSAAQASVNRNFGSDTSQADTFDTFKTINESQTINAIRELASTGQIRMSRTLEGIINRGYLVDPNATENGKIQQANAIKVELKNAAIAASNTNARTNGGNVQDYDSPLVVQKIDANSKEGMQSLSNARIAIAKNPAAKDAINAKLQAAGLPPVGN